MAEYEFFPKRGIVTSISTRLGASSHHFPAHSALLSCDVMEATSSADVDVAETTEMPETVDRLRKNYLVFLENITHVSDGITTTVETTKRILANYEGTSRNVPLTLRPLIENLELINTQLVQAIIDMRLNELEYAYNAHNADGRGTWRMLMRILLRTIGECNVQLLALPYLPKNESARQNIARRYTQSYVLPVLGECSESLSVLTAIFPTLMMVTFHPETLTDEEAKSLLATFYTHPFWYSVRPRFQSLVFLSTFSLLIVLVRCGLDGSGS